MIDTPNMLASDVIEHNKLVATEGCSSGLAGVSLYERDPHVVLTSGFTLEFIFSLLPPRTLCVAVRVNSTWCAVAYSQRALWREWDAEKCLTSSHPRDILNERFGRLRHMTVPASFVKLHGKATHCAGCMQPLPDYQLPYSCICDLPRISPRRDDVRDYFQNHFTELRSLSLSIPAHNLIYPSVFSHLTSLTSLCVENLNPMCASAYGALITQSPHLRALTYLTRPWEAVNELPFSFRDLALERLEVNQIDFDDIVHMASSLKSLKINGYLSIDKYTKQLCIKSVESLPQFTELEALDISGLDISEVTNAPWVALHVCMLSNLQRLDVGQLFAIEDFGWMSRDMLSLRAIGIYSNSDFSSAILQDFATAQYASTLTSLSLYNCALALSEPECLASFVSLRSLHIEQNPPHGGGTLRRLVPTLVTMTQLVDLALVGLSINPVLIYPKLTRLERLILNFTPTSDADVLIMSKKLPALQHLGLLGCYQVTLRGLLNLVSTGRLRVLEWNEPIHVRRLVASCPELTVVLPSNKEPLLPLVALTHLAS